MKTKSVFLSLLIFAMVGAGIVGCQKEQMAATDPALNESALLSAISGRTDDYMATLKPNANRGGRTWRIIKADLAGAVGGFLATYVIGHNNEYAEEWASGVGVVSGAAASIDAGLETGNSGGGGGGLANTGNPWDVYGEMHYNIVADIMSNPGSYFDSNGEIQYAAYFDHGFSMMVQAGLMVPGDRNDVPLSDLEALHPNALNQTNLVSFVQGYNHPDFLPTERAILGQYFGALMSSNSPTDFGNYSIGVENQIVASSLSGKSKALLLMEMATARRGYAYWE